MNKKSSLIISAFILLSSCYEDYVRDYDYDAVYFTYQTDVRTFVVGEGMSIKVGVALGGVLENGRDRTVNYAVDNSLITDTKLSPLPPNFYNADNASKFTIKKGDHAGVVTIKADSAAFLSDAAVTLNANYALALRITDADADTVPMSKNYTVIGLKYENMLFGHYWHGGQTTVVDKNGQTIRTVDYFTTIPSPDVTVLNLTTVAPHSLVTNKISNGAGSFILTLGANGTITVSKAPGSSVDVRADGESFFNKAVKLQDRKIFLKYKYENSDGTVSHATDTLTFRNRIRDGVNEWQ
ncbi:MAG: DUF1735 domain-containing protein [Tannerella sp.]|jgi:hypothetical protein|nr:DUF1735 domain-containing protein [Tannerella sp.]